MDNNELAVQILHPESKISNHEKDIQEPKNTTKLLQSDNESQAISNGTFNGKSKKGLISSNEDGSMFTSGQARALKMLMIACNFLLANGNSLQGPFYPKEAESKGAGPLLYSAIFASYELTMLLTSFAFNHVTDRFRPHIVVGLALFATGIATVLFGTLTFVSGTAEFVGGSFVTRILESLGATLFAICSYSFISVCFPTSTGATFGMMEMAFGLGMITGPILGGALYTIGGFFFPFALVGAFISALGLAILSPKVDRLFRRARAAGEKEMEVQRTIQMQNGNGKSNSLTLRQFLHDSAILFDGYLIVSAIMFVSFNTASLEPHLRHSGIASNPMMISVLFIAEGVSYSLGAMFLGPFLDRHVGRTTEIAAIGSICILSSLIFMGPFPGIEFLTPGIVSSLLCLFVLGLGIAAKQTAGYQHAMHHTIYRKGATGSQQTYGYVAAMFFTCLSLGGFIGPILAGSFIQKWNYRIATMAMFSIECFTLIGIVLMKIFNSNY